VKGHNRLRAGTVLRLIWPLETDMERLRHALNEVSLTIAKVRYLTGYLRLDCPGLSDH
jgi:hypothetical protein